MLLEIEETQKSDVKWLLKTFCRLQDWFDKSEKSQKQKELDNLVTRFKESLSKNKTVLSAARGIGRAFELRSQAEALETSLTVSFQTTLDSFELTEASFAELRETWHQESRDFQATKAAVAEVTQQGKQAAKDDAGRQILDETLRRLEAKWLQTSQAFAATSQLRQELFQLWNENCKLSQSLEEVLVHLHEQISVDRSALDVQTVNSLTRSIKDLKRRVEELHTMVARNEAELASRMAGVVTVKRPTHFPSEKAKSSAHHLKTILRTCDVFLTELRSHEETIVRNSSLLVEMASAAEGCKQQCDNMVKYGVPDRESADDLHRDVVSTLEKLEALEASKNMEQAAKLSGTKADLQALKVKTEKMVAYAREAEDIGARLAALAQSLEENEARSSRGAEEAAAKCHVALHALNALQVAVEEAEERLAETAGTNDVSGALRARWTTVKEKAEQQASELTHLSQMWQACDRDVASLEAWLSAKEAQIERQADLKSVLNDAKKTRHETWEEIKLAAKRVQDCIDASAGEPLKVTLSGLQDRLEGIERAAQSGLDRLANQAALEEDFRLRLDSLSTWIARKRDKFGKASELPEDCLADYAAKIQSSQEETRAQIGAIQAFHVDLEAAGAASHREELRVQAEALREDAEALCRGLEAKQAHLASWTAVQAWNRASLEALAELQDQICQATTAERLQDVGVELDNLHCQSRTRNMALDEEDDAEEAPVTVVRGGEPFSRSAYVAEVLEIAGCVSKLLEEKEQALASREALWTKFKSAEKNLAQGLQEVLQRVQTITVDTSTLDALKSAAEAVNVLSASCSGVKAMKDEYNALGKQLIGLEPSRAKSIQDAVLEANKKWERISNLLSDQNNKSRCLIFLWEQCLDIKSALLGDLKSAEEGARVLDAVPENAKSAVDLTDKCKKAIEVVKKCRYPFESFYKKQSQLIQELSTVPKFDVSPLKADLLDVQRQFTVLGNALTAKLNALEAQIDRWKELDLLFDHVENDLREVDVEMQTLDVADFEICKLKLSKVEVGLKTLTSKVADIKNHIGVLGHMNETDKLPELTARLEVLTEDLRGLEDRCGEFNAAIAALGDDWVRLKSDIGQLAEEIDGLQRPAGSLS